MHGSVHVGDGIQSSAHVLRLTNPPPPPPRPLIYLSRPRHGHRPCLLKSLDALSSSAVQAISTALLNALSPFSSGLLTSATAPDKQWPRTADSTGPDLTAAVSRATWAGPRDYYSCWFGCRSGDRASDKAVEMAWMEELSASRDVHMAIDPW